MVARVLVALLVGALLVPAAFAGGDEPNIPESIALPTKVVGGQAVTGTVCLTDVAAEDTEILLFSDNDFLVEVQPSAVVPAGQQCADFTAQSFARFPDTESVGISAFANGDFAQRTLYVIPREGVDLIEITKATVDRNFTKVTVQATSDEEGAVLTAFANGIELGVLEPKGDRYVGRFTISQPVNNIEVVSSLGGCAQRAVPNGNGSNLC
jgi:hypothetical protein